MSGYGWGLSSVALVSAAQLMMRYTMMHYTDSASLVSALLTLQMRAWWLPAGIFSYGLSMISWLFALHHLPLSRAYPLLSLSYIIVCLIATSVSAFEEHLSLGKLLGITFIIFGLTLIYHPNAKR